MPSLKIEIDARRLLSEIEFLGSISEAAPPAVTRVVFTSADMSARAWLAEQCKSAGLAIRHDAIGNMFVRWAGSDPAAPVVGTGSHIDAIPNAGRYDGTVGVLGGLEAIRALQRARFRPRHSIELLAFTSEEPTRFGIGCLGSRMLTGTLSPALARKLVDKDGATLDTVRRNAGFKGDLETVRLREGYYKAFVELHIEQGPILENEKIPLGVVTKISAPTAATITVQGSGGHAGGVLMADRRDALAAAAELILAIERAARASGSPDTVATVGACEVFPGAVNSIPSSVTISLDLRDTDLARRGAAMIEIEETATHIALARRVEVKFEFLNADAPANSDPEIVEVLSKACARHGLQYLHMVSRAYHDSLFMSRVAPIGMLFIPCHKGHSHRPDEYAAPEDIARGTLVLAETLATLAS